VTGHTHAEQPADLLLLTGDLSQEDSVVGAGLAPTTAALPATAMDISLEIAGDRGLAGLALDPDPADELALVQAAPAPVDPDPVPSLVLSPDPNLVPNLALSQNPENPTLNPAPSLLIRKGGPKKERGVPETGDLARRIAGSVVDLALNLDLVRETESLDPDPVIESLDLDLEKRNLMIGDPILGRLKMKNGLNPDLNRGPSLDQDLALRVLIKEAGPSRGNQPTSRKTDHGPDRSLNHDLDPGVWIDRRHRPAAIYIT